MSLTELDSTVAGVDSILDNTFNDVLKVGFGFEVHRCS